jgi:hypothetical protein
MTTDIKTDILQHIDSLLDQLAQARDVNEAWIANQFDYDDQRSDWMKSKPSTFAYDPAAAEGWLMKKPGFSSLACFCCF